MIGLMPENAPCRQRGIARTREGEPQMTNRSRRTLAAAALAALTLSAPLFAAAEVVVTRQPGTVDRQSPAPVQAVTGQELRNADTRPIMELLRQTPAGNWLDTNGINIYGHVEMGYTYNFNTPATNQNAFRVFDNPDNRGVFNQLDLSIERRVDYHKNEFQVGGLVELLYGEDSRFIHANGIFDYQSGRDQFDPVQFYGDITLPILGGARLRLGKFVNLVGFESINPTADFIGFYSRSFVFGSGYPFTHLGGLLTFDPVKNVTVTAGITRGDEQGFEDDNDSVAFLGSVNWVINDKMALYVSNSTGPEQPGNNSDYRTTWDATLYYQATDKCKVAGNVYYIYDNAGAPDGRSGSLFALAALASYELCREATIKGRAEWFHDHDGLRVPPGTDLYEVTVGLDVVPFAHNPIGRNLIVRPELRYDFSDDAVFNGNTYQFTFGIDAIFKL
jgi:hypothetical protein